MLHTSRAHQDCAANARKVLQDAITNDIVKRKQASTSNSSAAADAAKAAAARAAAAAIAAGGDGRELDAASAAVLGPLLDRLLLPIEQKRLLLPLLRLRQACLHPQVGLMVPGVLAWRGSPTTASGEVMRGNPVLPTRMDWCRSFSCRGAAAAA